MQKFISYFFPLTCALCHRGNSSICTDCLYSLPLGTFQSSHTFVLFSYKNRQVKSLLQKAKYVHNFSLYVPICNYLAEKLLQNHFVNKEKILIVPIPMHFLRRVVRGQNHTEYIAKYLAESLHLPYSFTLLIKTKYTKRQALLTRTQRLVNQKNSFVVKVSTMMNLQDLTIILVDDIMTTGSTLLEAKKVLEQAGVKKVITVVLAH